MKNAIFVQHMTVYNSTRTVKCSLTTIMAVEAIYRSTIEHLIMYATKLHEEVIHKMERYESPQTPRFVVVIRK